VPEASVALATVMVDWARLDRAGQTVIAAGGRERHTVDRLAVTVLAPARIAVKVAV